MIDCQYNPVSGGYPPPTNPVSIGIPTDADGKWNGTRTSYSLSARSDDYFTIVSCTASPQFMIPTSYKIDLDTGIGSSSATEIYACPSNKKYYSTSGMTSGISTIEIPTESNNKYKFNGYWSSRTGFYIEGAGVYYFSPVEEGNMHVGHMLLGRHVINGSQMYFEDEDETRLGWVVPEKSFK